MVLIHHTSMVQSRILVLAGTDGAGKSSVLGSLIRKGGAEYYNPDEVARTLRARDPKLAQAEANALAWQMGYRRLKRAALGEETFVFETTLGGTSIPKALHEAIENGVPVDIMYVGLVSADLHVQRVEARVEMGGHPIPERKIRERYASSILNLVGLVPGVRALTVWDNSSQPRKVIELTETGCRISRPVPNWAKPIVIAILKANRLTQEFPA